MKYLIAVLLSCILSSAVYAEGVASHPVTKAERGKVCPYCGGHNLSEYRPTGDWMEYARQYVNYVCADCKSGHFWGDKPYVPDTLQYRKREAQPKPDPTEVTQKDYEIEFPQSKRMPDRGKQNTKQRLADLELRLTRIEELLRKLNAK